MLVFLFSENSKLTEPNADTRLETESIGQASEHVSPVSVFARGHQG